MKKRLPLILWLGAALMAAAPAPAPDVQAALERISANSLRGHLSFIASDALEGRATPSRGLDIAAQYIAAQFRRAGLEPAGDDGYFQTARMVAIDQKLDGFALSLHKNGQTWRGDSGTRVRSDTGLDLKDVPVVKAAMTDLSSLTPEQVRGKALAVEFRYRGFGRIMKAVNALEPAVILDTGRMDPPETRLVDPREHSSDMPPWVTVADGAMRSQLESAPTGATGLTVSVHLAAPERKDVVLRNVVGVLPGSDPALRDTYELVTAHYDHIGMGPEGTPGDRIFNGANDDGSGTVSVIEIASALAAMPRHPRRTMVFMTFFGEERGGLGSRYYAAHPIFPLAKTIADVNLEQLGRTDASDGPQVGTATFTGFGFSSLPAVFQEAGKETGIKVYNPTDGDAFFNRSDNASFADKGVPAHTICVAFEYPDYHAVGDEWQKIDYQNMAKVDRMIALGAVMLADSAEAPHWISSQKTAGYVQAAAALK